jgi:hypothetical protein
VKFGLWRVDGVTVEQVPTIVVEYVRGYGVPINVLFFDYLRDGDREYLARSWLTDPELEAPSSGSSKKQAPWHGRDFFVAVGEDQHRNWEDMRRYGFVSAGHGEKYRKAMSSLFEGARVGRRFRGPAMWVSARSPLRQ